MKITTATITCPQCSARHEETMPLEQNTQQVPALGRSVAPHARHW